MAIFLTQYDVKLSDGTRKTFAGPDIDCWDLEEAQEVALEECELNSYKYYTYFDVDTVEED